MKTRREDDGIQLRGMTFSWNGRRSQKRVYARDLQEFSEIFLTVFSSLSGRRSAQEGRSSPHLVFARKRTWHFQSTCRVYSNTRGTTARETHSTRVIPSMACKGDETSTSRLTLSLPLRIKTSATCTIELSCRCLPRCSRCCKLSILVRGLGLPTGGLRCSKPHHAPSSREPWKETTCDFLTPLDMHLGWCSRFQVADHRQASLLCLLYNVESIVRRDQLGKIVTINDDIGGHASSKKTCYLS